MPANNSNKLRIDRRRRQVAAMRLRGLTQREIAEGLGRMGITNPSTGRPYDLAQVNRDIKSLREQWRAEALEDVSEARGQHLAEVREARREAWQDKKLFYVYEGLRQEADLLGLRVEPQRDWGALSGSFLAGVETGVAMQDEDLSE